MSTNAFDQSQREFLIEHFSDLHGQTLRHQYSNLIEDAESLDLSSDDAWDFYFEITHGQRCVWCGNQGELDGSEPHCDDCHERMCVA